MYTTSRFVIKINSNSTRFNTHTHTHTRSRRASSFLGLLFSIWDPMKSRRRRRRHSDENTQWKRICEKNGMSMRGEEEGGWCIESNLDWRACTKRGTMQQGNCKARSKAREGEDEREEERKNRQKMRQRIPSIHLRDNPSGAEKFSRIPGFLDRYLMSPCLSNVQWSVKSIVFG